MAPEVAADHAQRFRQHDERLLVTQHLVHDDEAALIQSAQEARVELVQLFEADRGEGVLGGMTGDAREDREPGKSQGTSE